MAFLALAMAEIPEEEASGSEHPPTPLQLAEFVVVPDSGLPDPNYTVGSFLLPPSTEIDAGRVPIILVASAGPQFVVAVPGEAWHRQPALRVLPKNALTKPISVLVAACSCDDREVIVPDTNIKIWLGLLKEQFLDELEFPSSVPELCIFPTENQEDNYLHSAEALMQIADEKYAFLTAESGSHQGRDPTEDQGLRLSQLEESMAEIRSSLAALLKRPGAVAPVAVELPPAKPRTKPKVPSQEAEGFGFAGLDRQVVQNALAAGVPADHLEQLGKIARQKRTRMTDAPGDLKNKSKLNVLGESEEEDVAVAGEADAPQLDPHGSDPMSSAVLKLTAIMETLSGTGKKKSRLLEDALDEVGLLGDAASSSSTSSSSRKHAAVLRSLRKALTEAPGEICSIMEQRMQDDFGCRPVGPGAPGGSATYRGWAEHRSRIPNINTTVRVSWSICGALDALSAGRTMECKARLLLLLAQMDQLAVDRGQWALAAVGSLEEPPPFSSFTRHVPPDYTEAQHTRLWPTVWAEALMHQVRELDEFIERRSKLGRRSAWPTSEKPEDPPKKGGGKETKGGKDGKGKKQKAGEDQPPEKSQ